MGELAQLSGEMIAANRKIGVTNLFTANFPDNKFDSIPLLDIVKKIEQ